MSWINQWQLVSVFISHIAITFIAYNSLYLFWVYADNSIESHTEIIFECKILYLHKKCFILIQKNEFSNSWPPDDLKGSYILILSDAIANSDFGHAWKISWFKHGFLESERFQSRITWSVLASMIQISKESLDPSKITFSDYSFSLSGIS